MNFRNRFSRMADGHGSELGRDLIEGFTSPEISSVLRGTGGTQSDGGNARASRVNRTHRVVQERAKTIAARRSKIRSLWAPLVIFSTLLVGICIAVWAVIDEYELAASGTPGGIQSASYQMLVPLFWSVPVSAALLAVVWFRQSRDGHARRDTGRG